MLLGMMGDISDGNSRAQILNTLGFKSIEELRNSANTIWKANYSNNDLSKCILASSLWLNKNIKFKQDTVNGLANNYFASSYSGKMGSDEYNNEFHNWLNEQTDNLLKDQANNINFDANTLIALATTICFKAKWSSVFKKEQTVKGIFHAPQGDITCDFMNATEIPDNYIACDTFTALERFMNDKNSMRFILPNKGLSINDVLNSDSFSKILYGNKWNSGEYYEINESIPKFDVNSDLDLIKEMKNLGITDIFDSGKSNFTPLLSEHGNVAITEAKHAARVQIDEDGCTAAALSVGIANTAMFKTEKKIDFILDRPFIFVITGEGNMPLFVGVVNHP